MSTFTKNCAINGKDFDMLKITFNKQAQTATLHGTWGVSSTGYSYKLTPMPQSKTNEVHLEFEEIKPTGRQFCVMPFLEVNADFAITDDTSDVYIHVVQNTDDIFSLSDDGKTKKEMLVMHCSATPDPA